MLVIHNPTAGGRKRARLDAVCDILRAHGVAIEIAATHGPGHATELARVAAAAACTRIVVAGGDGTIAEAAAGLLGTQAALGIVPAGTANVLAHERGLPFAPAAIARMLVNGGRADLWPAQARTAAGTRTFVQMCGVGFDARVVATLSPRLKRTLGRGAYVLQSLGALPNYHFPRLRLALDGRVHDVASAVISKGRFYAGPYTLLPGAQPGAPGFHVALFSHGGSAAVLLYGTLLPLHLLWRAPGVTIRPAREVRLLDGVAPVQTDGDPLGWTPLHLTDAAAPISLIVP